MNKEQALAWLRRADLRTESTWYLAGLVQTACDDTFTYRAIEQGRVSWTLYDQPAYESATLREALIAAADMLLS